MRARGKQRGLVGAIVLGVLILLTVALIASYVLSRMTTTTTEDRTQTQARLQRAQEALEQFVATAMRLPCPANPADSAGEEPAGATIMCTYPTGTLPWKSIGMRKEDAFDNWGRKLSYRVFNGATGLTQAGGASMVNCDTIDPAPAAPVANGLCNNGTVAAKNTTPALFVAGKGFSLTDMGTAYTDVAYLIISHGVTGLGSYSASGVQREMPAGDERGNTRATGAFTIKAFSDPDTAATSGQHFDDLLVYRRIADLAKKANLYARNWPDTVSTAFNAATVSAAVGSTVSSGQTLTNVVTFPTVTVSGFSNTSTATEITYVENSGTGGLGVAGAQTLMTSATGEFLRFEFNETGRKFAATLSHFGTYSFNIFGTPLNLFENAEFRFYVGTTQVGSTTVKTGCTPDGGLASFSIDPGVDFNRVEIQAATGTGTFGGAPVTFASQFLISEVKSCAFFETSCATSLAVSVPGSVCP